MTHGHRDFTVCSCSSLPVLLPGVAGPPAALKCSTTAVVSGEPVMRSARTNARRRIAASRHCGSGCNQAPRPGSFLAESTVTAHSPFPSSTATTRSSSTASSRFRQPTHVRTGPSGASMRIWPQQPKSRAGSQLSLPSPHRRKETALPGTSRSHATGVAIHPTDLFLGWPVSRRFTGPKPHLGTPRVEARHHFECRCASRSAGPRAGRSGPPCRSRVTAGNPAPRHAPRGRPRR